MSSRSKSTDAMSAVLPDLSVSTGDTLKIELGKNADTTGDITVAGTLIVEGGTFTVGNGVGDFLTINGTLTVISGNLTVSDDIKFNGTGTISGGTTTSNDINGGAMIVDGTLTVSGGTLECEDDLDIKNSLTISGGMVKSNTVNAGGMKVFNGATLTISSGGIMDNNDNCTVDTTGTVNLSGGTYKTNSRLNQGGLAGKSIKGTFTMTGGTYESHHDVRVNGGSLSISAGTVESNKIFSGDFIIKTSGATCTISGGTVNALTGALGARGWLLDLGSNWPSLGCEGYPWFPSATVYRRTIDMVDWRPVLERVVVDLRATVEGRSGSAVRAAG